MKKYLAIGLLTIMLLPFLFCRAETAEYLLHWTAVGDDGYEGTAADYDIRICFTSDTSAFDWENADLFFDYPYTPKPAGQTESFNLTNLPLQTPLTIGMKVKDDAGNLSGVSNKVYIYFDDNIPPAAITDLR